MKEKAPKYYSKEAALKKAQSYCAYQERCHNEVRHKLLEWGQRGITLEEIISQLISDDFLNEERFAFAFAGGKFRIKGWGLNKIINALKSKHVSSYCINKAIKQIQPMDYKSSLIKIIDKKSKTLKEENSYKRKYKLAQYAAAKGYDAELVWEILNKIKQE